jgi:hypothetical protein
LDQWLCPNSLGEPFCTMSSCLYSCLQVVFHVLFVLIITHVGCIMLSINSNCFQELWFTLARMSTFL